jgi:hypothetical protein
MEYSLKTHHWPILVSSLAIGMTLVFSGCEGGGEDASYHTDAGHSSYETAYHTDTGTSATNDTGTSATDTVPTNAVSTNTASTNTISTVLNDDPNCELVVKYQSRSINNDGQVHYVNRVLTSDPFGSANPICVQYNDTRTGEVTVWKDPTSTGQRIDILPSDRGINKIVVWYK